MRVELSGGQWAELREPATVTEAGRREFKIATVRARDPQSAAAERAQATAETDDYMVAMFISAWSFDVPIPQAGIVALWALPASDYDLLVQAVIPLGKEVFTDFSPTPDQDAPFLEDGTAPPGVGGVQTRRAGAAAARVASVPAGVVDGVDA